MRELEFVPAWYVQTQKRRRAVVFQAWLLLFVIAGLAGWTGLATRNVHGRQLELTTLQDELDATHAKQKILTEQSNKRQELQDRAQLVSSLGYPVEMTRLFQTLDTLMPRQISLKELDCTTEEKQVQSSSIAAVRSGEKPTISRKLKIRIQGVAPSDVDVANFLSGLNGMPIFEQAAITQSRDIIDNGHILRSFEVVFWMNLDQ